MAWPLAWKSKYVPFSSVTNHFVGLYRFVFAAWAICRVIGLGTLHFCVHAVSIVRPWLGDWFILGIYLMFQWGFVTKSCSIQFTIRQFYFSSSLPPYPHFPWANCWLDFHCIMYVLDFIFRDTDMMKWYLQKLLLERIFRSLMYWAIYQINRRRRLKRHKYICASPSLLLCYLAKPAQSQF